MPGGVNACVPAPPVGGPRSDLGACTPAQSVRSGPVHVLKFGSSVLAAPEGYRSVAGHVRDEVARGRKVIAVVSAMGRTTDTLLTTAKAVAPRPPDALVSALLATGEEASVALLGIALADVGVPSTGFTAARLAVRTRGALWDAEPVDVDTGPIAAALDCSDVVIVPGFVGVDVTGVPSLLGRGGSDLTALFLGHAIGAAEVRLIKDVDGIYPADPRATGVSGATGATAATGTTGATRGLAPLRTVSWDQARRIGGGVVQDKALRFAASNGLAFRVAAMGGCGTRVGTPRRPSLRGVAGAG